MLTLSPDARDELLRETLKFVFLNSDFYRDHLGRLALDIRGADDLHRLPRISKRDIVDHHAEVLTSTEPPAHVGTSSGSTFGKDYAAPHLSFFGKSELDVLDGMLRNDPDLAELAGNICVQMHHGGHGAPLVKAPGIYHLPYVTPGHFDVMHAFLTREHAFATGDPKPAVLGGSLNQIRSFLQQLEGRGIDARLEYRLRLISPYGRYCTTYWRERIGQAFDCAVRPLYGLSEVIGSSSSMCPDCFHHHPQARVITEYVDLEGKPITDGYGEILFTTLLPFTSLQPYVRYRSGDLIEVGPKCPLRGTRGFRPLGRLGSALNVPQIGLIVPSGILQEFLDRRIDLHKRPHGSPDQFPDPAYCGQHGARWRVTPPEGQGPVRVCLEVEMKDQPDTMMKGSAGLTDDLQAYLCDSVAGFRRALETNTMSFAVEALGPGQIDEDTIRF